MKSFNRSIGRLAEELAVKALVAKGYEILDRNFANKFGEVDIVARDKETVVFVEVKAKTGEEMGSPEEMVDKRKLKKVKRMGWVYLVDRLGEEQAATQACRIDVVAIVLSIRNELVRLTHYENVY